MEGLLTVSRVSNCSQTLLTISLIPSLCWTAIRITHVLSACEELPFCTKVLYLQQFWHYPYPQRSFKTLFFGWPQVRMLLASSQGCCHHPKRGHCPAPIAKRCLVPNVNIIALWRGDCSLRIHKVKAQVSCDPVSPTCSWGGQDTLLPVGSKDWMRLLALCFKLGNVL